MDIGSEISSVFSPERLDDELLELELDDLALLLVSTSLGVIVGILVETSGL